MRSLLVVVVCAVLAYAVSPPCSANIRGDSYNLDPLSHNGTTDWTYTSNSDNVTYYINVCNNLVSSNPCGNDVPAYMYDAATGDCMRLGLLSAEWWGDSYFDTMGQEGVVVMYTEGDSCLTGGSAKISNVFHCDPTTNGEIDSIVAIGQYCHWVVHWSTKYGCPF